MLILTSNKYNHVVRPPKSNPNMFKKLFDKMDEFNNSELYAKITIAMDRFHNNMAHRIKCVKKGMFRQGKMMKNFDLITKYYKDKNFKMLEECEYQLQRNIPRPWETYYYKYEELIWYCQFLQKLDASDIYECCRLKNAISSNLTVSHELGASIHKEINRLCNEKRTNLSFSIRNFSKVNQILKN